MKNYNLFVSLLIAGALFVSGCGGGGGDSDNLSSDSGNSTIVKGTAQLGYISGGDVKLYELSDLNTPIAVIKSSKSTEIATAGSFSFEKLSLNSSRYYLLEISNGKDIDPNDDGKIDVNEAVDLNGSVYALAKGADLEAGHVRINVLSDMAYQKLKGSLSSLSDAQIESALEKSAKEYLYDVNGDGVIDAKDILAFDPVKHRDKTKKSYKDILDVYIPKVHTNAREEDRLSSLMYVDNPRITVENGNLQEVPFSLKATVTNIPATVAVLWYINGVETANVDENIVDDGVYDITAKLYIKQEVLKTIETQVIATHKTEIASIDINATQDNILFVKDDSNSSLNGTQIIIPKNALSEDVKITVKKASLNTMPTINGIGISDVLVLEPSGLIFNKPIQIRLPYNRDVNLSDENVRIARYSEGGEIDYIAPLFIDEATHEVVFETEHFTAFKLETIFFYVIKNIKDQTEIQNIIDITALNNYSNEEWSKILNYKLFDSTIDFRVYDLYLEYKMSKKVHDTIALENQNVKYYGEAYNLLYKDSSEIIQAQSRWNSVKQALELMNTMSGVGGNLAKSEYMQATANVIEASLGIDLPNSVGDIAGWLNPYNPISLGDDLVKILTDTAIGEQIQRYFEFRDAGHSHAQCFNQVGSEDSATATNENGWYKNGLSNGGGDLITKKSIDFWKNVDKMYNRDKLYNTNSFAQEFKKTIENTKKLIDNNGDNIQVSSCTLTTQKNQVMVGEEILLDYSCEILASSNSIEADIQLSKYDYLSRVYNYTINKIAYNHYTISLTADKIGTTDYYVNATYKLTANKKISQFNTSDSIKIQVKENKPTVTITSAYIVNYYFDDEENFIAEVSAEISNNENFEFTLGIPYHRSYTKGTIIRLTKAEYNNLYNDLNANRLSDFGIVVIPSNEMYKKYYIVDKSFGVNLKEKIDELKENANNVNAKPVALPSAAEINKDTINYPITLNGIDTDKDPLTFIVVTQPQHGTLSGSGKNRLYTPYSGYTGTDSIEFKVNDGKADSTQNATVSLTITEPLSRPKITSLSPTTATQNIATTFTILGENLPSTIAMSLYGSLSCQSVNYISSTQVTIVCTPNITGTKAFIVAKESGGDAIDSNVVLEVSVESAPVESICDMEKSNHSLASLLFNLPSANSYDNPGYVTAQYLMEPYDHLIPGVLAHAGVDFRSKDGSNAGEDTVYSLTSGEVVRAENATGYGIVAIKMKNIANQDSVVFYAHLSSTTLNVGDTVNVGSIIGRTGKEGTSAPHLHLEYRVNYTGTSMIYKTSCGGDECTKAQIEDRTDDPIELLGFSCTEQKSLSELIVGKKVFQNYCGEINSLEFRTDGTIVNIDANATQSTQTYRIEGNTAYVTFDGEEKAITLVEHTSEYIRMSYGATMYFIEAKAQENPDSKNCSNNSSYDTGGTTLYNGKSYSILKAKSYMSDMQENPVQMFLKTSNSNINEEGGFQLTINKFKDNNELKSFLQNNSSLLLAPGDFTEYGLQYMLTNNNPTGVTLSGSIKLTWLNDNNRFTIEQNGATLNINGKNLTFSKTIVQWTDENHSTNSGESKVLNWSGKLVFRDTNGNIQPLPSNLAVRITPNEEQINDKWGGVQVDVDSNGEWLVEEVQSSNYVDTTHYTTTNNYQFIVVDKDTSQEIYPFYDCNNNFLMINRIEETQEYVSTAIISDFTKTIELSSTNECNNFSSASFSTIKKTGQTKSYDKDGNEVTDGSLKDDGYYQKGVTPRYTRASDIVTDEITGLMWQDDEAAKTVAKPRLSDANYDTCKNDTSSLACNDTAGDTATTYCSELTLGGYTDWRLPSSVELEGIVDYGKRSPAIDTTYFNNASSNAYWSSTTYEGDKSYVWVVVFNGGAVGYGEGNFYVRCVRNGQ